MSLVEICKSTHKEGYTRLYEFLSSEKNEVLALGWWPNIELAISEAELSAANRSIVQFKDPLNATLAQIAAPRIMRESELKLKESYVWLSHFIVSQAVRAVRNAPKWAENYDHALLVNPNSHHDGLRDARRHTIWAALLSRYLGPNIALCALAMHETEGDWSRDEGIYAFKTEAQINGSMMDFFNNAVGVALGRTFVGTDDELIREVERLMRDGKLAVLGLKYEIINTGIYMEMGSQIRYERYRDQPLKAFIKELF